MSDLPSPLKSAVALICQLAPGLVPTKLWAVGVVPFINQMSACPLSFCQDVGLPIVVEVAGALDMPGRTRIAETAAADNVRPVDQPDVGLAAVVLPQHVGFAVAIEIGGGFDMPGRPGIGADKALDGRGRPIHQPNVGLPVIVLPQDVGLPIVIKVPGALDMPGCARIAETAAADAVRPVDQPDVGLAAVVLP